MVWNITIYEVAYRALRRSTAVASAAWSRMDCRIQRTNLTLRWVPAALAEPGSRGVGPPPRIFGPPLQSAGSGVDPPLGWSRRARSRAFAHRAGANCA